MTVRIGFIGVGAIATEHLRRLIRLDSAEIVALSDLELKRIEAARARVNEKTDGDGGKLEAVAYTDYRLMIRNERLDAVFVCVPPFARSEPELAVLEAGLHMFVEKPLGLDLAVPDRVLREVQERDVLVSVGYLGRYAKTTGQMKELAAQRTIGMALVMRFGGHPALTWYHRQDRSGGQLIDQVTHQIDLLRYVIGEVDTVYAAAATRINNKLHPEYDVFDVNTMTLTFENGVVANVAHNMISRHGVPALARGVHIFCEDMTLTKAAGSRSPLEILTKEGVQSIPEPLDPMYAQDEAFVQAVVTGERALIRADYLSGLQTLAVTLAGDVSARRRQPVKVLDLLHEHAPHAVSVIEQRRAG